MRLNFKLTDSSDAIYKQILMALLGPATDYMKDATTHIKIHLPSIINNAIMNSPEYSSLTSGSLRLELGIPDATNKISGLLNIWINNIQYTYNPPAIHNNKIISTFSAEMIKINFDDVIYSDFAIVRDAKGYTIPWLEWLLTEGNRVLVPSYDVIFGPNTRSRTGNAVMKKTKQNSWKVPAEFSGTISDNWITRAIDAAEDDIQNMLNEALKV
jgi:hypothetical protein